VECDTFLSKSDISRPATSAQAPIQGVRGAAQNALLHGRKAGSRQHRRECHARHRARAEELLLAGSDAGGDRAAAIYTIVQTAKLNGVNAEVYLRDTPAKIAEGHPTNRISKLMPWNTEMTDIHQTERELD